MNQSVLKEMFRAISIKEGLLPLKVTPFYHRKIKEEVEALGNHLGPLHRVSFPTQDRLLLRAPNEVKDFVDDRANAFGRAHKTSIVRKYADRILFLITSECFGNCQYCFRTNVLTEIGAPTNELDDLLICTCCANTWATCSNLTRDPECGFRSMSPTRLEMFSPIIPISSRFRSKKRSPNNLR